MRYKTNDDITLSSLTPDSAVENKAFRLGQNKKRIYNHFKGLNRDDAYKYHVKYQTLLLNTELLKSDILKHGDIITLILRNKTVEQETTEQRKTYFLKSL